MSPESSVKIIKAPLPLHILQENRVFWELKKSPILKDPECMLKVSDVS